MRELWRTLIQDSHEGACTPFIGKTDAQALKAVKDEYAIEDPASHIQVADDASLLRLAQIYREECER